MRRSGVQSNINAFKRIRSKNVAGKKKEAAAKK